MRAVLFASLATAAVAMLRVPVRRVGPPPEAAKLAPMSLGVGAKSNATSDAAGVVEGLALLSRRSMGYAGQIRVGTPGQEVTVVFDTGYSSVWVPRLQAARSTGGASFDPSASRTYSPSRKAFRMGFGQGSVSGRFCEDDVAIGDLAIKGFVFAEVFNASGLRSYDRLEFDGVFGLGLGSTPGAPTVMQRLVKAGQLEAPVFGFYLGKGAPGELVLGGVDPEHYVGDFNFVELNSARQWSAPLDSVQVAGRLRLSATSSAVVDSGTSLLVGPEGEVQAVAAMLGAGSLMGFHTIPCDAETPSLVFSIGGRAYPLEAEDLIVQRLAGGLCILGLQALPSTLTGADTWILGDVFMRKYYVQFDWGQQRLGFALAKRAGDNFV